MTLCDSHLHLQDARLTSVREECIVELRRLEVRHWGVNGTRPSDWASVAGLAREYAEVCPSYGLHPWFVREAGEGWEEALRSLLSEDEGAAVGEIGLDKWIRDGAWELQGLAFKAQLRIANELGRPVTIHCLKAWGSLLELFRQEPALVPQRGFLLHSYGGPGEMIEPFRRMGARFSFSGYFLEPRKEGVRNTFRKVPPDCLLIETDAPDMLLPVELDRYALPANDLRVNHPANIVAVLEGLAEVLGLDEAELAGMTLANHRRLFGRG